MDEFNNIQSAYDKSDFEEYFNKMDISDEDKQKRIDFADEANDILLFIFALIDLYVANETIQDKKDYLLDVLTEKYTRLINQYSVVDDYIADYILNACNSLIDTTFKHIGSDYYISSERAFKNACDNANDVFNYDDYSKALISGKTMKQWLDVGDRRERESHLLVGGKTIPITDYFTVGVSKMMFPHDTSLGAGAEELANCRCAIRYF